jgi:hypothetical protein
MLNLGSYGKVREWGWVGGEKEKVGNVQRAAMGEERGICLAMEWRTIFRNMH